MKHDTFERLYAKCQDHSFQHSENIGNVIPFYIIPYQPKDEKSVFQEVNMLVKRLDEINIRVVNLDLFSLCIDLLKEQDILDDVITLEQEEGSSYFLDAFDSALNDDFFSDAIQQRIRKLNPEVVFIQGVGRIYPFKRVHPLINKMHAKTEGKPIVFFYPGSYDGNSFKLFDLNDGKGGEIFKSNYYQAYNLE